MNSSLHHSAPQRHDNKAVFFIQTILILTFFHRISICSRFSRASKVVKMFASDFLVRNHEKLHRQTANNPAKPPYIRKRLSTRSVVSMKLQLTDKMLISSRAVAFVLILVANLGHAHPSRENSLSLKAPLRKTFLNSAE